MALFLGHTEISLVGPPITERLTSGTWTKLTLTTILLWRSSVKTFETNTTNPLSRFFNGKDNYCRNAENCRAKDDKYREKERRLKAKRHGRRERGSRVVPGIHFNELSGSRSGYGERMVKKRKKRRKRGCPGRVQRVSWNDSLSVMRGRTKESPLYTTECSVYYYYISGQWLTPPPIETNT